MVHWSIGHLAALFLAVSLAVFLLIYLAWQLVKRLLPMEEDQVITIGSKELCSIQRSIENLVPLASISQVSISQGTTGGTSIVVYYASDNRGHPALETARQAVVLGISENVKKKTFHLKHSLNNTLSDRLKEHLLQGKDQPWCSSEG